MRPLLLVLPLLILPLLGGLGGSQSGGAFVYQVDIDGVVTQGTAIHVRDAISAAESDGAAAVLIRLDTPGGLVDATFDIHQAIIASDVPVLTFVGPSGGFAASAGTLILLMGHPNAMAPSTTIGSAQPIVTDSSGGSEPASDKVENFVVEQVKAIAERTGRNVTQAVRFVTENDNLLPDAAVEADVVDVVVEDEAAFLAWADGRLALVGDGSTRQVLATDGAEIREFKRSLLSQTVDVLSNPQIAFLFVLAGTYAVVFGLANPGSYVPETIGALLLILGFIGIGLFSTSLAGVVLLILALIFFVAEVFTPTHGVLTATGVAAMIFAVIFLLDEPLLPEAFLQRFRIAGILAAVVSGAVVLAAITFALRSQERPVHDTLRGAAGKAIEPIGADAGRAEVHGEIWRARSDTPIEEGAAVRVIRHEGLTLWVEALSRTDAEE